MTMWSFRQNEILRDYERSRGLWERAIKRAGVILFGLGIVGVIGAFFTADTLWDDLGRLAVPFLLAAIGCYCVLCFSYLAGIFVELSYLRERLLEETTNTDP